MVIDKGIRGQLMELAEEPYQKFSSALIPTINNVLGVRLPLLRKLAKQIAKEDWRSYLEHAEDDYFEEVMLQGMVIGCLKTDINEILRYVAWFVPKMDNWSVCDSFCVGLKATKQNKELVWQFVQPYLASAKEYEMRFGVVMLLNYYIEEKYICEVLKRLDNAKHEGYYVKMAVAWALSICHIKQPEATMSYLATHSLDPFTCNKALQKIIESHQVTPENKAIIRSMKQK